MTKDIERPIICVSGGFDPIHKGHIRLIENASLYGSVVVILNSDEWLIRKKGYCFMNWKDRSEILLALRNVSGVAHVNDDSNTVCEALARIKPDFFANGGDRRFENTPEIETCEEYGIKMIWAVGGEKVESSSELVNALR